MSGINAQKPVDIAKQKVDNVKNFEGNKNGVIDTREEISTLSIFLQNNSSSLTAPQIDFLEKEIKKGEKEVAKLEAKAKKEEAKKVEEQLGELGKRIKELSDENGYVTIGGAKELADMLGKGILTGFQETYIKDLLTKSGFENLLPKEQPQETVVQNKEPEIPITPEEEKPKTPITTEEKKTETPKSKVGAQKKNSNSSAKNNQTKVPPTKPNTPNKPQITSVKSSDIKAGEKIANSISRYLGGNHNFISAATVTAQYLSLVKPENAFGFFKALKGGYCRSMMFGLQDPGNNIRFDVIKEPIDALLAQAAKAGLKNANEYKAVENALADASNEVKRNDADTSPQGRKSGDLTPFTVAKLDVAINGLVKTMSRYIIIE